MTPTDEQLAIIDSTKSSSSLMISAYAGCAKTSTLQMAAEVIHQPALALAFNKKIAEEIRPKLPQNFNVRTLNSMGHMAWARKVGHALILDDKKLGKLVTEVAKEWKINLPPDEWQGIRDLVSQAMMDGIILSDEEDRWNEAAIKVGFDNPNLDLAREILQRNNLLSERGTISFDDQIYASVCLGGIFPRYPVVFIDEAQDLSPLNHAMLQKCLRDDGQLIAVGDPKQAIYGFRGADSNSMTTMRGLRPSWTNLPLTLTFRCPKVVVSRQQDHAPGFRAAQSNRDGFVKFIQNDYSCGWDWNTITSHISLDETFAVLCRNNAPLLSLAFKLIRQGIGPVMLGRDIGKGLVVLSRKLAKADETPIVQVLGAIEEWKGNQIAKAKSLGREDQIEGIYDRAGCLEAVIDSALPRDAGQLRAMLEKLFDRQSGSVTLSSIHRAKGLEWDTVLHLDPWRIPSKQAKLRPELLEQEYNLNYVAETRTKDCLILADLEDFR